MIFPGLGTDGSAVAPLRAHCQAMGYDAFDWGEGFNTGPQGDIDAWLAKLASRVSASLSGFDQSATLIGWSLGGLYARELGKLLEPQVRQVITIATPFNATDDRTNVGWLYRLLGGSNATCDPALSRRLKTAPPVPTTSIYSRSDGVVAWQTCLQDRPSRDVQDIEIRGSHIGMGWNTAALKIIADRLAQRPAPSAQRPGQWRPYALTRPERSRNWALVAGPAPAPYGAAPPCLRGSTQAVRVPIIGTRDERFLRSPTRGEPLCHVSRGRIEPGTRC